VLAPVLAPVLPPVRATVLAIILAATVLAIILALVLALMLVQECRTASALCGQMEGKGGHRDLHRQSLPTMARCPKLQQTAAGGCARSVFTGLPRRNGTTAI